VGDEQTWKGMCERSGWTRQVTLLDKARSGEASTADLVGLGVGMDEAPEIAMRQLSLLDDAGAAPGVTRPNSLDREDEAPAERDDSDDDDGSATRVTQSPWEEARTPLRPTGAGGSSRSRRRRPTSLPLPNQHDTSPSPTPSPALGSPFRPQAPPSSSSTNNMNLTLNPFGASTFPPPHSGFKSLASSGPSSSSSAPSAPFSYKTHFKRAYLTEQNWLRGPGRLLNTQISVDDSVVTSLGFDGEWIVVGMATSLVHVFESSTGQWVRTLKGHELGVWCLVLVSKGGGRGREGKKRASSFCGLDAREWSLPPGLEGSGMSAQQASVCGTARGWGQEDAVVVTGGCDRDLRVWNVRTGECRFVLHGHTSTIRCLKVLDGRPIAVSGSRDATMRVWDIETGRLVHLLVGHHHSVRCIEVSGNKVVSGSYDATCRVSSNIL
jgi:hypothetical protein